MASFFLARRLGDGLADATELLERIAAQRLVRDCDALPEQQLAHLVSRT
jgi:hypothetical protein